MPRCITVRHLQKLVQYALINRNAIPEENHLSSPLVQILCKLLHGNRTLLPKANRLIPFFIDTGVNLVSPGIHNGTHQILRSEQIKRKAVHRGNRQNRLVQNQRDALCRRRTDPKSRKASRPFCNRNRIQCGKIQLRHALQLIQHGNQRLRVCFLILYVVISNQLPVTGNGAAGRQSGSLNC